MNTAVDQFAQVTKHNAEAQLHAFSELAEKALHSVAELAELNLATAKASLEEGSAIVQEILAAKDPQAAAALLQSHAQPAAEKAASYGRHLAAIATKAQAELGKVAQERLAETTAHFNALVNDMSKVAPAGTEPMVDLFKGNLSQMNAMFDQFTKVGQSAYEQFQSQMNEMGSHFGVAAKPAREVKPGDRLDIQIERQDGRPGDCPLAMEERMEFQSAQINRPDQCSQYLRCRRSRVHRNQDGGREQGSGHDQKGLLVP